MKQVKPIFYQIILFSLLFGCNQQQNKQMINIPEGQYALNGQRAMLQTMQCGMTDMTFGNTLMIIDGKIETHPLRGAETVHYVIRQIADNEYITKVFRPVMGDTASIEFSLIPENNQLRFLCGGAAVIYQKQ